MSQGEMASVLNVSYQALSEIYTEFVALGMMLKNGHKFYLKYDPDRIPWGEKFNEFRAKFVEAKKLSEIEK